MFNYCNTFQQKVPHARIHHNFGLYVSKLNEVEA